MSRELTAEGWQVVPESIDPKRGFEIHQEDSASDPRYFGYVNVSGRWVILKQTVATKTYRYTAGKSGFTTAWANRASLGYDYVNVAFKGLL